MKVMARGMETDEHGWLSRKPGVGTFAVWSMEILEKGICVHP
jgi:hypothetical protein